jgi:hypothetical protein
MATMIDRGGQPALVGQVQLVGADLLGAEAIRRLAEVAGEAGDLIDVRRLRVRSGLPVVAPERWQARAKAGAPGRTRTCDPRLRRPMLYPLSYGRPLRVYRSGRERRVWRDRWTPPVPAIEGVKEWLAARYRSRRKQRVNTEKRRNGGKTERIIQSLRSPFASGPPFLRCETVSSVSSAT